MKYFSISHHLATTLIAAASTVHPFYILLTATRVARIALIDSQFRRSKREK